MTGSSGAAAPPRHPPASGVTATKASGEDSPPPQAHDHAASRAQPSRRILFTVARRVYHGRVRGLAGRLVAWTACLCACGESPGATPADAGPDAQSPPWPRACDDGPAGGFCALGSAAGLTRVDTVSVVDPPSGGIAVFDADGDGDLDLYATGLRVAGQLFVNDGAAGFADGTSAAGLGGVDGATGVAAADLDGDGDSDLVLAGWQERVRLYENDGAGHFAEVGLAAGLGGEPHGSESVVAHDVDNDARLDLYVTNWVDLEGVDLGDLFTYRGEPNLLYRNDGGLSFTEVAGALGVAGGDQSISLAAAFVDVDGDGAADLHVANDFGMLHGPDLDLRHQAGGLFAPAAPESGGEVGIFGMSVSPADYDDDGDFDVYLSNLGANVLLANDGSGAFVDVATAAGVDAYGYLDDAEPYLDYRAYAADSEDPLLAALFPWSQRYLRPAERVHVMTSWAALWFDYDHDRDLDLYVCNGYQRLQHIAPEGRRQPNRLYRQENDGAFTDVTEALGAGDRGDARGCATGDLDGDGDLDLVIANTGLDDDPVGGRFTVLRNDAAAGHYLVVHLRGVSSNRDGIGAVVEVTVAGTTLRRLISGGDAFLSSSQRDAHFGLGAAMVVDVVTVRWPAGTVDRIEAVAADRVLNVVEGESPAP